MENKKYLDKVVEHLVRSTEIDYENKEVNTPFNLRPLHLLSLPLHLFSPLSLTFSSYCKNMFGLTDDEMEYVWKEYRNIINDKIENGE